MHNAFRHILTTLLLLLLTSCVNAQEPVSHADTLVYRSNDTTSVSLTDSVILTETEITAIRPMAKKRNIFVRAAHMLDGVTDFFMGCDTSYITPQQYEFTAQLELSSLQDFYQMRSSASRQRMSIESNNSAILGAYVYWSIIGYGHSINLDDIGAPRGQTNGTGFRNAFSINTARIVAEFYNFRSGKSAKIKSITGYEFQPGQDRHFSGLNSRSNGFRCEYIFNHRKYSWPAAFGENAVQRRSRGTFKLGYNYNHVRVTMNHAELPEYLRDIVDTHMLFDRIDYRDYAVNIGYAYNWAFARNCLFAFSFSPAVGYRKSNIQETETSRSLLENICTDLVFQASLFWNNTRYFSGLTLDVHTYAYRKDKLGLTNTYGTLKYIIGFNFIRKR